MLIYIVHEWNRCTREEDVLGRYFKKEDAEKHLNDLKTCSDKINKVECPSKWIMRLSELGAEDHNLNWTIKEVVVKDLYRCPWSKQ